MKVNESQKVKAAVEPSGKQGSTGFAGDRRRLFLPFILPSVFVMATIDRIHRRRRRFVLGLKIGLKAGAAKREESPTG
jgi:hypothetical protein